jgi:hypothetical protein
MTYLPIDHHTRTRIAHLDRVDFTVWLMDGKFRVVFIELGYLVLFDHRSAKPIKWLCNWKYGRRKQQAHELAIDDVMEKLRHMVQREVA